MPKTLLDRVIIDKALDRASRIRRNLLENGYKGQAQRLAQDEERLAAGIDQVLDWQPSMRRGPMGMKGVLESGKFKNQFEAGRSGGLFSAPRRSRISDKYFKEFNDSDDREKYGYLERPANWEGYDDVGMYGSYKINFKPQVKQRMTINRGDTLNEFGWDVSNEFSATPIVPGVPETYLNWIGREYTAPMVEEFEYPNRGILEGEIEKLEEWKSPTDEYVEAQYHGPLGLEDVSGIRIPVNDLENITNDSYRDLIRSAADKYGFRVRNLYDKCIYNCR